MNTYGKYDVVMRKNGKDTLYKVCPNKAYACTVAREENTAQYMKGIYIADPRFVNYIARPHKEEA